jgi:tetratricopeptide (TPR) repeat protein
MLLEVAELAPTFSPALSSMVQIKNIRHMVFPGMPRQRKEHEQALDLALRAVRFDPLDSRAQLCLAWSNLMLGRVEQATMHAMLAVNLNDNDPWTISAAAHILAFSGQHNKSIDLCERSLALTPFPSQAQRSYALINYFLAGRYADCIKIAVSGPEHPPCFEIWVSAAHAQLGQLDIARSTLTRAVAAIKAAWHGQQPPSETDVHHWMMHINPIILKRDWERLQQGLLAAGAPVENEQFGVW